MADELDHGADAAAADPLLTTINGDGETMGLERSVRGIDTAAAGQSLSDVWFSDIG